MPKDRDTLIDYDVGRTIGSGAFSVVKLCYHKKTRKKYAVKIIDNKFLSEKNKSGLFKAAENNAGDVARYRDQMFNTDQNRKGNINVYIYSEVQLLMRLDHPNIVKLHQYIETVDRYYIVTEYASGGELVKHVLKNKGLPETEVRRHFRNILSAVDHCHLSSVVHRDIKLENILLTGDGEALITDFGLGRLFDETQNELLATFCGTPDYAAAELVAGIQYSGVKSDVWSLGVVLFFMAAGRLPFIGHDMNTLYTRIKLVDYTCPISFSTELVSLLASIFVKDPDQRIDIEGLRSHPWTNIGYDELPLRVYPSKCTSCDTNASIFISGILYDKDLVTFTFRNSRSESSWNQKKSQCSPSNPCLYVSCRRKDKSELTNVCSSPRSLPDGKTNHSASCVGVSSAGGVKKELCSRSERQLHESGKSQTSLYEMFKAVYDKKPGNISDMNESEFSGMFTTPELRELSVVCRMTMVGLKSLGSLEDLNLSSTGKGGLLKDFETIGNSSIQSRENEKRFLFGTIGVYLLKSIILKDKYMKDKRSSTMSRSRVSEGAGKTKESINLLDEFLGRSGSLFYTGPDKYKLQKCKTEILREIFHVSPTNSEIVKLHEMHRILSNFKYITFPLFMDVIIKERPCNAYMLIYTCFLLIKEAINGRGVIRHASGDCKMIFKMAKDKTSVEIHAIVSRLRFNKNASGITFKCASGNLELFKFIRNKIIILMREIANV